MHKTKRPGWEPDNHQWILDRTDTQVQDESIDIYFLLHFPSGYCLGSLNVVTTEPLASEVEEFLLKAFKENRGWPPKVTLPKGDPAESIFRSVLDKYQVRVEVQPKAALLSYTQEFKSGLGEFAFSPAALTCLTPSDEITMEEIEAAKAGIPDSYDPCPCASGNKYKFCCKRILREVMMAMVLLEERKFLEALEHLKNAEKRVGRTAEVLCRLAIVYHSFDPEKYEQTLQECISKFPSYPRAYYLRAIEFSEQGKKKEAIESYERAIQNYLPSDKYHLNEALNNVGKIYFEQGEFTKAKSAWERAFLLLPSDTVVKENLVFCIYTNETVPEAIRKPSPFVLHFMKERKEGRS